MKTYKSLLLCVMVTLVAMATHANALDIIGAIGDLLGIEVGENVLEFNTGEVLNINIDVAIDLRLEADIGSAAEVNMPDGYLDAEFAYNLIFEGDGSSEANADCEFETRELDADFISRLGADFSAIGAVQYDSALKAYHRLDDVTFDEVSKKLKAKFNGDGQIRVIGIKEGNLEIPTLFGKVRKISKDSEFQLSFPEGFNIDMTAEGDFDLKVNRKSSGKAEFEGRTSLDMFFDIEQSVETTVDATMQLKYEASAIADAGVEKAENLRIALYNEAESKWEVLAGGSVDVDAEVVVQSTAHFSEWGVYEVNDDDIPSSASRSSFLSGFIAVLFVFSMFMF